jgi:hypothetical protein
MKFETAGAETHKNEQATRIIIVVLHRNNRIAIGKKYTNEE